jgi:bacterioferritin
LTNSRDTVLRLLQDDLAGEHAAIIQYLQHVWRMGSAGGDIPCEVQEIARDEMRHFRWVAELVVDLGTDPTIERDVVYVNGSPPVDLMLLDVDAEDRAIRQYMLHASEIDDQRITRLIERILVDERVHREMFRGFVTELGGDPDAPTPRPDVGPFSGQREASPSAQSQAVEEPESTGPFAEDRAPRDEVVYVKRAEGTSGLNLPPGHDQLIAAFNSDVGREYTTVLQYLFQSFVHKSNRLGKELQLDMAQWHMKHWGWMAERISELGAEVAIHHDQIDRTRDAVPILRADIARQRDLASHYGEERDATDDDEAQTILGRIQAHDEHQVVQLEELLRAAEAGEFEAPERTSAVTSAEGDDAPGGNRLAGPPGFTIGSLIGRSQDE